MPAQLHPFGLAFSASSIRNMQAAFVRWNSSLLAPGFDQTNSSERRLSAGGVGPAAWAHPG